MPEEITASHWHPWARELWLVGLEAQCHPWGARLQHSPTDGAQGTFWCGVRMCLKPPAAGWGEQGSPTPAIRGGTHT